jgi:hypothetical protein
MKHLHLQGIIISLLLVQSAFCQSSSEEINVPLNQHPVEKPALFGQLPQKFDCPLNTLNNIFTARTMNDNSFRADISNVFHIEGIVIARTAISPQQLSINIRCTNFNNALLNISRIIKPDGSIKYTGRVVSPLHGDILLLQENNGQYSFIKQKQLLTMVE